MNLSGCLSNFSQSLDWYIKAIVMNPYFSLRSTISPTPHKCSPEIRLLPNNCVIYKTIFIKFDKYMISCKYFVTLTHRRCTWCRVCYGHSRCNLVFMLLHVFNWFLVQYTIIYYLFTFHLTKKMENGYEYLWL